MMITWHAGAQCLFERVVNHNSILIVFTTVLCVIVFLMKMSFSMSSRPVPANELVSCEVLLASPCWPRCYSVDVKALTKSSPLALNVHLFPPLHVGALMPESSQDPVQPPDCLLLLLLTVAHTRTLNSAIWLYVWRRAHESFDGLVDQTARDTRAHTVSMATHVAKAVGSTNGFGNHLIQCAAHSLSPLQPCW